MNHIHEVRIHNFQSHRKTTLELHPGVNAIVGVSDSGKSAFFRALMWAITNKPKGDSFRSKWGGKTSVCIDFADRTSVERSKDGENLYVLDDVDSFTAFKDAIPDAINDALNMDDINLQTQIDAPFLLSASSGDVAKLLNRVANLSNIDTTLSNIRKRTQSATRDIANIKEQIEELEKEEKSFAYLEQMEEDVNVLNNLVNRWGEVEENRKELNHLLAESDESLACLDELSLVLSFEKKVEEALTTHAQIQSTKEHTRELQNLLAKICLLDDELQSLPDFDSSDNLLAFAMSFWEQKTHVRSQWLRLGAFVRGIEVQQQKTQSLNVWIQELEKKFHDEFPDECPLCGART